MDKVTQGMEFISISMIIGSPALSGRLFFTRSTFFFRSSYASSVSVPYSYSSMTMELPSLELDVTDLRPLKVPTWSSMGFVMISFTSSGLAPE